MRDLNTAVLRMRYVCIRLLRVYTFITEFYNKIYFITDCWIKGELFKNSIDLNDLFIHKTTPSATYPDQAI
jgi:hypothetical protein